MRPSVLLLSSLALSAALFAASAPAQIELVKLGTHASGLFDMTAAEISGYDAATKRLFVTNSGVGSIDVLDLTDPSLPVLLNQIDLTPLGPGANSVAVARNLVAVAVEAPVKTDPGFVVFFDTNGIPRGLVVVGAQPDMLTFTPDGTALLVACEGEPADNYTYDPIGTVAVIHLPAQGVPVQSDVTLLDFAAFDNAVLDPSVRVFGPGSSASQDFEPEYITVPRHSNLAYVTLQENNAVAIIDWQARQVLDVVGLGLKHHDRPVYATIAARAILSTPDLGTTAAGQTISLGGLSGLFFEGLDPVTGHWRLLAHPDRGPNAEPLDVDNDGIAERPFPLPDYQARWVRLDYDPVTETVVVADQVPLTDGLGNPITGRPNLAGTQGLAYADEEPVDLFGNALSLDPLGGDFEGVVVAGDGTVWMVDEYRPALYHFDATGALLDRFVPAGSNAGGGPSVGTEAFGAVWAQRRANRGFEAAALDSDLLYAFIQSPLDNPDTTNDASSKASALNRILVFDTVAETAVAEYLYVIEGDGVDKVGDAVRYGAGEFLVLERDSAVGPQAEKLVFHIDVGGATNLLDLPASIVGPGGSLELTPAADLGSLGIVPVRKSLWFNLADLGYDAYDKPEGLALIGDHTLAVINDDDFGLLGSFDPLTGLLDRNPAAQDIELTVIEFRAGGLDASDRDDAIHIRHWPVLGMYLPDAIASVEVMGQTYLLTANEGDAREWGDYEEEASIKDLDLDPTAFPDADWLQQNEQLGRLKVTDKFGDTDDDGDFDELWSFGARSFSVWNTAGELVWDSGDLLEQITAAAYPDDFNSTNDENDSFDNRSDNKGPEPEGVTVGYAYRDPYAFVGLERMGGVAVFDLTTPTAPRFVQYLNNRDFAGDAEAGTAGDLGPEGLLFVSARQSPLADTPLLIVTNEVSGTTTVYAVLETLD